MIQTFSEYYSSKSSYISILNYIYENHHILTSKRGQKFKESTSPVYIEILSPDVCMNTRDMINSVVLEYFPVKFIEEYAINVASCIEEPGEFDYSYGGRLNLPKGLQHNCNQLEECINKLSSHPDTRQATVILRLPEDIFMSNPPCMTVIDFKIRNNKLNSYTFFRSEDMLFGFPANYLELLYTTHRVSSEIGVEIESINFLVTSPHYYIRSEELVKLIIGDI